MYLLPGPDKGISMFRIAPKRLDDRIDVSSAKIGPSEWDSLGAIVTYKPVPEIELVPKLGVTTGHLDVYETRLAVSTRTLSRRSTDTHRQRSESRSA